MKKERIWKLVNVLGIPALATALGLILLFNPDSAAVLVCTILGWLLVLGGAVKAISMAHKHASTPTGWIVSAIGVVLGVLVLKNPLLPVESIGRFLGVLLAIRGINDLRSAGNRKPAFILAIATIAVGAVLLLVPLTLTRAILRLCGVAVAVIGAVNILEKLQEIKLLEAGSDPNIIDADE